MLKPKELRFSGIGPFVEEQVIKFDELGNLVQIIGESGAGKSTIFKSMDFLFGINNVPNTVLETYVQKMPMNVVGIFDYDGLPLTITRGKGKLSIDLDGELTSGSNKLAEEKLDQIIGMDRELFRPLIHKRQREGGFFLNFTPKKKYEFLTNALNLSPFLDKIALLDKNLLDTEKSITQTENELTASMTGLESFQNALASLGSAPVQDIDPDALATLKKLSDEASVAFQELVLRQKTEMQALESQRPNIPRPALLDTPFDSSTILEFEKQKSDEEQTIKSIEREEVLRVAAVNNKIQDLKAESYALNAKVNLAVTARAEAVAVAAEIKKIRQGICSTCEQPWVHDSAKVKEEQLLGKIAVFKAQIEAAETASAQLSQIEVDIQTQKLLLEPMFDPRLEAAKSNLSALANLIAEARAKQTEHQQVQNQANKALMDEYHSKLNAANSQFSQIQTQLTLSHAEQSSALREAADQARRALDISMGRYQSFVEAKTRFDQSYQKIAAACLAFGDKIKDLQTKLAGLKKKQAINEEVKRAVKSYVSTKFDDALDSVGEAATRIIRNIPNTANATIQLDGTRETADGKVKEEVNCVIHKDGFENIPIASLSGGERSSVDLAVDLAVIEFLEERSNKGVSIFIMDEPFTGLTTAAIEQCLEMLQNYKSDKQIILTDHNPVIEEFIQSKISVSKSGSTSTISLI